ncbi:MAG: flippase-like domain-containing protein [Flavobacteriales bacterium]|nr:flippase-like domain-containing protein [Flavobacteriales bacterium]
MATKKFKSVGWFFIKAVISISGLYLAYIKTDITALKANLNASNFLWLIPPFFLYAASKGLSALRLNLFFKNIGTYLSLSQGVLLYWLGMFYNLFLPGGIGGDAYKVMLLNKYLHSSWKKTTSAVLYDRITGMMALLFLADVLLIFIPIHGSLILALLLFILLIAFYLLLTRFIFPDFMPSLWKGYFLSLIVQGLQILAAWSILHAMHIKSDIPELLILFLISSVFSALPFTIGGVGARELTFVYGSKWLGVIPETGVGFSLLFFLISAVVSLPGTLVSEKRIFAKNKLPIT